jgi:hypothetical protein
MRRARAPGAAQEVRVQEEADQVPVGHVPRALTVHAYGETTRACSAGDIVDVSGIFLPVPFAGGRGARTAGLIADTFLEASRIVQEKKASTDERAAAEMAEVVSELAAEGAPRCARSPWPFPIDSSPHCSPPPPSPLSRAARATHTRGEHAQPTAADRRSRLRAGAPAARAQATSTRSSAARSRPRSSRTRT